jgi:hypothetical protein
MRIGGIASSGGIRAISRAPRPSYLWRHFATTGPRANEYEVFVPFGCSGRYAVFSFRDYRANGVMNMGRIKEGIVGAHQLHGAATKAGTWTTSTQAEALGGNIAWSATANDTITLAATGHTLILRGAAITNAGFALVSIDDSWTAANRLPTVTQADVDAGYFVADDLGKRYLSGYTNTGALYDEHFPIAEGLTNGPHTVVVRVTGTKLAASSAARVYISGLSGATGYAVPGTSGTSMCYTRKVSDQGGTTTFSALGVAPEYTPDGFVNYQFIGENHDQETQSVGTWKVDGATVTPTADSYTRGTTVALDRTTALTHASTGATVVAAKVATYSFTSGRDYPARLAYTLTWSNAGSVRAGYHGMLHVGARKVVGAGRENADFQYARVGAAEVGPFAANDGTNHGAVQTDTITFYSPSHPTTATVHIDTTVNVAGWANGAPNFAFVEDRADLEDKAYFARSTSTNIEAVAVDDVHSGVVEWRVYRP